MASPSPPPTFNVSPPLVPFTTTLSADPSPVPDDDARLEFTVVTPVPLKSLTVTVSEPPSALKAIVSTALRSIVMAATSRVNRTRPPLADTSMFSFTLAPLKASVSVPFWPSTMSLPSPGFHKNVSLSSPSRATSLPRPPRTKSSPGPPMKRSEPKPPFKVSLPAPPSIVVISVSLKMPPESSTVTVSLPSSVVTAMLSKSLRLKPRTTAFVTSTTSSVVGSPPRSRSETLSLAVEPVTTSVPFVT